MKVATQVAIEKAIERARKEGYAVIGLALKPDDEKGMIRIDNQNLDRKMFDEFLSFATDFYIKYTTDKPQVISEEGTN